jgi:hypothetical protein
MLFGLSTDFLQLLAKSKREYEASPKKPCSHEFQPFFLKDIPVAEALKLLDEEHGTFQVRLAASLGLVLANPNGIFLIITEPLEWMWSTIDSFARFMDEKGDKMVASADDKSSQTSSFVGSLHSEVLVNLADALERAKDDGSIVDDLSLASSTFEEEHAEVLQSPIATLADGIRTALGPNEDTQSLASWSEAGHVRDDVVSLASTVSSASSYVLLE